MLFFALGGSFFGASLCAWDYWRGSVIKFTRLFFIWCGYFPFGCGAAICYNTYHSCFHQKLHLMEDMLRD
jgi:hypothetical protein